MNPMKSLNSGTLFQKTFSNIEKNPESSNILILATFVIYYNR